MQDIYTNIFLKFVLSFVATFLLVGFGWLFGRRKVQNYQSTNDAQTDTAQEVQEPEPFRWYYIFFILIGVLFTLWLLPILAGSLLAMCIIFVASRCFGRRQSDLPRLRREEALRKLSSFIEELDTGWERDGLDWAPDLLKILHAFVDEASKSPARNSQELERLRNDVHAYFERYKFLKGIDNVREWVEMIYESRDTDAA